MAEQERGRAQSAQAERRRSGKPCCGGGGAVRSGGGGGGGGGGGACCQRRPQCACCRSPVPTSSLAGASSQGDPCERPPPKAGDDALNTEFVYFSAALRQAVPQLEDGRVRRLAIAWLRKLFSPEYHCPSLRDKRNRFLMALAGALLAGAAPAGMLARPPPLGPLPELRAPSPMCPTAWQRLDPWAAARVGPGGGGGGGGAAAGPAAAGGDATPCPLHAPAGEACPAVDSRTAALLDDEFRLLTWLSRPRARALASQAARATASAWARALAVFGPDACPLLKGMRNDYALALLSQLHDGQLRGPLEHAPAPGEPLLPLAEAARRFAAAQCDLAGPGAAAGAALPFCDLAHSGLQHFVRAQPRLDSGAFCYVLVNP